MVPPDMDRAAPALAERWQDLRRFTTARVALGRAGHALPTSAHLEFQEAHARARDAVWSALDVGQLERGFGEAGIATRRVASEAPDRRTYLLRPDLGRRLPPAAAERLHADARQGCFAIVVADGLCASGVQQAAIPLVRSLLGGLERTGWIVAPVVIATQARVALADDVGEALDAAATAIIIGERPGLSALDSVGIYLTWSPRRGRNDSERNCISNIRTAGLTTEEATHKLLWLIDAARRLGKTGVLLKEATPEPELPTPDWSLSSAQRQQLP